MKRLRLIVVLALVIVVQLFFVMQFTLRPVNLANIPYRAAERAAAMKALAKDHSPESMAALQQEDRLAANHVALQQFTFTGVVFVALLSCEGVILYLGRNHESKYNDVAS